MWSEIATATAVQNCRPPFSFYFDLVRPHCRAPDANNLPLHRVCTLARKLGATWVVVESALQRADVRADIDSLDDALKSGGAAEAISFSFFATESTGLDLATVEPSAFLGQAVVINYKASGADDFTHSYVYEAVIKLPCLPNGDRKLGLLNNYVSWTSTFQCKVLDHRFNVDAVYYCQQNGTTHVCAHAVLRMALRSGANPELTPTAINEELHASLPSYGLNFSQIETILAGESYETEIIDCAKLSAEERLSALASIVESGDRALLVFTTENRPPEGVAVSTQQHVVVVYGYTRNSDEWHPQAVPAYTGAADAPYLRSSSWIDHYLIHDDNFGPYYTLNGRALESDRAGKALWIVALRRKKPGLFSLHAEAVASVVVTALIPQLSTFSDGAWFNYIASGRWDYILRTLLLKKSDYLEHLKAAVGHDQTSMHADDVARLGHLPDQFWAVEFTFPSLFAGNRTKLGEVLVSADALVSEVSDLRTLVLAVRLPSLLLVRERVGAVSLLPVNSGLKSHSPIYRASIPDQEW